MKVTPAQVAAAQLLKELIEEDGEIPDEAIVAIANAEVPKAREVTIRVHEIATDGLPDMDVLVGRVAFIFDGSIVSGWPLDEVGKPGLWEGDTDVSHNQPFGSVTHWVEFPVPINELEAT